MKSTGIVRKCDELGRLYIPSNIRNSFNWNGGSKGKGTLISINLIDGLIYLNEVEKNESTFARRIDALGRITIPKEFYKILKVKPSWQEDGAGFEFLIDNKTLILKKFELGCVFCNEYTKEKFNEIRVCSNCKEEIAREV